MQSQKWYKHQFSNLDIALGGQLWLEKFIFSACLKNLYLEKCALFLVALNQKVFWDISKSFQDVHLNQKSIEFQPASLWNAMTLVTLMRRAWANSWASWVVRIQTIVILKSFKLSFLNAQIFIQLVAPLNSKAPQSNRRSICYFFLHQVWRARLYLLYT